MSNKTIRKLLHFSVLITSLTMLTIMVLIFFIVTMGISLLINDVVNALLISSVRTMLTVIFILCFMIIFGNIAAKLHSAIENNFRDVIIDG